MKRKKKEENLLVMFSTGQNISADTYGYSTFYKILIPTFFDKNKFCIFYPC